MVTLTTHKIDIDDVLKQVEDHGTGAVALFIGRVRNHAEGKAVLAMDYEAYPEMAKKKLRDVVQLTSQKWPVSKMAIVHRTGNLQLGDVSVAIAVATPHRADAFEACRFAIDTLKKTVPIWKKEHFADGQSWVAGVIPDVSE